MDWLKTFLNRTLRGMKAEKAIAAGRVFALWPEIVGPAIAPRTRPRFLREGVLFVEVASSAWANELTLLKPRIMRALEDKLGKGLVKDVRWQVVPTWAERPGYFAETPERPGALPWPELAPERAEAIAREVGARIPDPEVARSMESLLAAMERRQASKRLAGHGPCRSCGALIPGGAELCPVCRLTGE